MMNWETTLIPPEASIRAAIQAITKSCLQIALIVDEGRRLLGTVTDGDIRRGILRKIDLEAPVSEIMNTRPFTVRNGTDNGTLLALMKEKIIHQIPLIEGGDRVVGLALMDDLLSAPPHMDNWVVLMAGGLGERLRPLTESTPKPLMPVGNKPILEHILQSFVSHGFQRFYISVNYKAKAIKDRFGDGGEWNAEIRYLEEKISLGTAGALGLIPERSTSPLIVMNGDLLTRVNFAELLRYHREQESRATMCVREYDVQVPFGVVDIEEDKVRSIDEKPIHKFFVNAGIYVLEPDLIDLIPKETVFDMTTLFEKAVEAGHRTSVFPIHEYWLDVGRVDDLERANSDYKDAFEK